MKTKICNIVYISYSYWPPDFGGELLISVERFNTLQKLDFIVNVITSGRAGFQNNRTTDNIIIYRTPIVHNSKLGRAFRRILFSLIAFIKIAFSNYDVVHYGSLGLTPTLNNILGWLSSIVVKLRGKNSVWVHSLADSELESIQFVGINGFFRKLFLGNIKYLISVSPNLHEGLNQFFSNTHLLPCAIRDDIFKPMPELNRIQFRQQHNINSKDQLIFSFLGSIGKRKGFDLIAQSFENFAQTKCNWFLWVIGPTSKKENQNLNESEVKMVCSPLLPYSDRVKFWGRIDNREELAKIIAATDVFLFPSRQEGMGIAPMEAMAVGVPPIISRIPGVTDVANIEGVTGMYITPGSVEELKHAMLTIAENNALRRQMGINAMSHIQENFSWQEYIRKWENIYRGII